MSILFEIKRRFFLWKDRKKRFRRELFSYIVLYERRTSGQVKYPKIGVPFEELNKEEFRSYLKSLQLNNVIINNEFSSAIELIYRNTNLCF